MAFWSVPLLREFLRMGLYLPNTLIIAEWLFMHFGDTSHRCAETQRHNVNLNLQHQNFLWFCVAEWEIALSDLLRNKTRPDQKYGVSRYFSDVNFNKRLPCGVLWSHVFFIQSFSEWRSDSRRPIIRVKHKVVGVHELARPRCMSSLDPGVEPHWTGVYETPILECMRLLNQSVRHYQTGVYDALELGCTGLTYTLTSEYRMRYGASVTSNVPFNAKCESAIYAHSSNCKTVLPRKKRKFCNQLRNGSVF